MTCFKTGIFSQLVASYVAFAISLVLALFITVIVTISVISSSLGGPMENFHPLSLSEDPNSVSSRIVMNIGGWLEVLNEEYEVVSVTGQKRDDTQQYSPEALFALLSMENTELTGGGQNPYRGFMKEGELEGDTVFYLVKMPRDAVLVDLSVHLSNENINQRYFFFALGVFILLFALNSLLMGAFLSRKIKQPLLALRKGMLELQNNESAAHLDFKAQMEFEEIRDTFNLMSERLRAEKQEKENNERLKNQLLLDLSHDIKTPIATIKAYGAALEADVVQPEDRSIYAHTIVNKADRVNHLVEDLFHLLQTEHAAYRLQKEKTDLSELVRTVCGAHYTELSRQGFDLEVRTPSGRMDVMVDRDAFKRVLENLLSNAGKYNRTGHTIEVMVSSDGDEISLEVIDDGTLIPLQEQARLFDPFARGDEARTTRGGSGLGLAISKRIVEKHDGRLLYRERSGKNSFIVYLPDFLASLQSGDE